MIKRKPKGYWTYEKCEEIALKYENKRDFRLYDNDAYNAAKKHSYNQICSHMKPLNNAHYRCIYAIEFIESNSVWFNFKYFLVFNSIYI